MRPTTRVAAVLAGGLGLVHPHAVSHATLPPKPAHVRHQPATQPASAPASQPKETAHEQALRAYRATQRGPYDDAIVRAAERWKIDPFLMRGLFQHESKMDPGIVNPDTGAAGIGQMTSGGRYAVNNLRRWRGEKKRFTIRDALNPHEAIPAAAEMLSYAVDVCRGLGSGVAAVLAWYNAGKCRAQVPKFVLSVVRIANKLRIDAGLPPIEAPRFWWRRQPRMNHAPSS